MVVVESCRERSQRTGSRFSGLDGLRGIAAAVVVIHHGMLVAPVLADSLRVGHAPGWAQLLTLPPGHLFWAGSEAVIIFFVLSGFVLVLPFHDRQAPPRTWSSYLTKRLVRLYVPVAGALGIALTSYAVVSHRAADGMSWWVAGHDMEISWRTVLSDLTLIPGTSWLNSVLWSLRLEVVFSLALPAIIWCIVRRGPRVRAAIASAVVIGLLVGGLLSATTVSYMIMFLVGVLMAAERTRIKGWSHRLSGRSWLAITVFGGLLMMAGWWPVIGRSGLVTLLSTTGAALLVAVFAWCTTADRVSSTRPIRWLGKRSFSLYLTHEPVVISVAFATGSTNPVFVLAVSIPIVVALTALFYEIVERPSLTLATLLGARVGPGSAGRTRRMLRSLRLVMSTHPGSAR